MLLLFELGCPFHPDLGVQTDEGMPHVVPRGRERLEVSHLDPSGYVHHPVALEMERERLARDSGNRALFDDHAPERVVRVPVGLSWMI